MIFTAFFNKANCLLLLFAMESRMQPLEDEVLEGALLGNCEIDSFLGMISLKNREAHKNDR